MNMIQITSELQVVGHLIQHQKYLPQHQYMKATLLLSIMCSYFVGIARVAPVISPKGGCMQVQKVKVVFACDLGQVTTNLWACGRLCM
jgi:hypothetical protein